MQTPLIHVVFPIHLYAGIILFVVQIVYWVIRKCKNDFVSSGMLGMADRLQHVHIHPFMNYVSYGFLNC